MRKGRLMSKLLDIDLEEQKTVKEWLKIYGISFDENQTDEELRKLLFNNFMPPKKLAIEYLFTGKTPEKKLGEAIDLLDKLEYLIFHWVREKNKFIIDILSNGVTAEKMMEHNEKDNEYGELSLDCIGCLKTDFNELYALSEVSPTAERMKLGKKTKAKKPDQIKAEEWVKDVWRMHPDVTQGQMAIDVKDALDLPQTIKTITGWIKPLDPQKGKRKRKPKDYYQ